MRFWFALVFILYIGGSTLEAYAWPRLTSSLATTKWGDGSSTTMMWGTGSFSTWMWGTGSSTTPMGKTSQVGSSSAGTTSTVERTQSSSYGPTSTKERTRSSSYGATSTVDETQDSTYGTNTTQPRETNTTSTVGSTRMSDYDCGVLPSIENGYLRLITANTTYGSNASIHCDTGYHSKAISITCMSLGIWGHARCILTDCGRLPYVINGSLVLDSSSTLFGSTATVACVFGFTSNKTSISCLDTGVWEDPLICYKGGAAMLVQSTLMIGAVLATLIVLVILP